MLGRKGAPWDRQWKVAIRNPLKSKDKKIRNFFSKAVLLKMAHLLAINFELAIPPLKEYLLFWEIGNVGELSRLKTIDLFSMKTELEEFKRNLRTMVCNRLVYPNTMTDLAKERL